MLGNVWKLELSCESASILSKGNSQVSLLLCNKLSSAACYGQPVLLDPTSGIFMYFQRFENNLELYIATKGAFTKTPGNPNAPWPVVLVLQLPWDRFLSNRVKSSRGSHLSALCSDLAKLSYCPAEAFDHQTPNKCEKQENQIERFCSS